MRKRYFGTDGIRGLANGTLLTPELALKVGQAAGRHFLNGGHRHRVLIGKDTRLSGYMLEQALTAGFTSVGMDVVQVGPMPTPAVALLTREMRADLGVMISASHNLYQDNGIKLFGPDGFKLSDADEAAIRIVLDCAHGAAWRVAPEALWELGADLTTIGAAPDGFNINADCGSTHPAGLAARVREAGADIGIALDGDADRLILVDEQGEVVDGDQILALISRSALISGRLKGGAVAATVMSNLGLEHFLEAQGVGLLRTPVGDRHVLAAMRAHGLNVGGEQSGHLILSDYSTTGDGLLAALQVLAVLVAEGRPASEVLRLFQPYPQLLENVRVSRDRLLDHPGVQAAIAGAEAELAGRGRLLVRPSGTEPLIRVMAEAEEEGLVRRAVGQVCEALRAAA